MVNITKTLKDLLEKVFEKVLDSTATITMAFSIVLPFRAQALFEQAFLLNLGFVACAVPSWIFGFVVCLYIAKLRDGNLTAERFLGYLVNGSVVNVIIYLAAMLVVGAPIYVTKVFARVHLTYMFLLCLLFPLFGWYCRQASRRRLEITFYAISLVFCIGLILFLFHYVRQDLIL